MSRHLADTVIQGMGPVFRRIKLQPAVTEAGAIPLKYNLSNKINSINIRL